ncbi:IS1595 family transposase [Clostridium thermarum]|uniref:IS1595 family transposase n=1 Tax=Clostridium thermarum TaxID=1716543 RepID=UPI0011232326|nr:IS1595 family transposase [Clostridium thermarum]
MSIFIRILFELIKIMDLKQLIELKDSIFELNTQLSEEEFISSISNHSTGEGKVSCPHCGSQYIVKYGLNALKNQRYKCKDCGKHFCNRTNTPMSYSKKPLEYWYQYFKLMCSTNTIRHCSSELKINIATAFQWRHKILNSLMPMLPSKLKGIVEIDEIFFIESFKGNHSKNWKFEMNRPAIKRKLSLSQRMDINKVSVLCCRDRQESMFTKVADTCKTRFPNMLSLLSDKVTAKSTLCTNNNMCYIPLAKKLDCKLYKMRDWREVKEGQYHIHNASSLGRYIKTNIHFKFRGVATKYLNFYLSWLQWLEGTKNKKIYVKLLEIISICLFSNHKLRVYEFVNLCPLPQ